MKVPSNFHFSLFSGVRPFGVSLLICGWNEGRPYLFQSDPSGAYFAWKATAMGKNYVNGKTFLEKRYNEDLELEDAIHTAILTLKVSSISNDWICSDFIINCLEN